MEYNNSQRGVLTYVLSILAILSLIVFAFNPSFESELEPYIIGSVFIAVLVMFYRLTIKVNNERIRGIIRYWAYRIQCQTRYSIVDRDYQN